jgi:hypothetical protein
VLVLPGIEDVIVAKRRKQYEGAVKENPHNYDAWFDYVRLEEGEADLVCAACGCCSLLTKVLRAHPETF